MTKGEFHRALKGFYEHEQRVIWLMGIMNGKAFGASEKYPYPTLEEFMNPKESPPEPTDEEIFDLAKEKGIEVPEWK
jgi:hypothetical protein